METKIPERIVLGIKDDSAQKPLDELAQIKHLVTDGAYIKTYLVPAGVRIYTKQFPVEHVTILAVGSVLIEDDDQKAKYIAPVAVTHAANSRRRVTTLENCVWYCIHPTDETDLVKLTGMF
jgi:hypothetical protein